jgi:response regulator NasT
MPYQRDGRATVVVAEDEAVIRMDLVEHLAELGFDVVGQCGDGATAVALCRDLAPELALLDISMPTMDGVTAARQISALGRTAVVMLTAYSQRQLVEQAIAAGAMTYLVKPWSPAELLPALEVARSRFAEMRALTDRVDELSQDLATRKIVERAKSRLVAAYGLSEEDAFRWLQKAAMDRRTTMRDVAEAVLQSSGEGA